MLDAVINLFTGPVGQTTLKYLLYSSYVWIPAIILYIAWDLWVVYVRAQFQAKQTHLLLEIRLPREVYKSPKAAEFFIASLYQTVGEKNWFEKYWEGKVRAHFSLEITSIKGQVRFWMPYVESLTRWVRKHI